MADILNTWANIQLGFAYNLGQNSAPATSTPEYAKRDYYLNEARFEILNERDWWFTKGSGTDTTVADQQEYTLPTDCEILEQLWVNDSLPYERIPYEQKKVFDQSLSMNLPLPPAYGIGAKGRWYVFDGSFGILPKPSGAGDTINLIYRKTFVALDADSATSLYLIPVRFRTAWTNLATAIMWEDKGREDKGKLFRSRAEKILVAMREFDADYEPIGEVYDPDFAP